MESRVGETLEKVLKTPKISIIVPVYNGEKYLEKSVDCILSQTLSDLELILVDDGSQDQSGAICDRYAREDRRVRVIHQENQGVSVARNMGIAQACGTYIGFVDADDWIAGDMLEQMLEQAQKTDSDVVMCDAWTVFEDGRQEPDTIVQLNTDCILDHKSLTADLLPDFAGAIWRCIYRTDLIRNRGICFPKGQKFSEDRVFNIYAMGYANRVCYLKKPLYMRFVNMESCVHGLFCPCPSGGRVHGKSGGGSLGGSGGLPKGIPEAFNICFSCGNRQCQAPGFPILSEGMHLPNSADL